MYGKESYNTIGKGGAEELERMEKIRWIIKKEFEREREIKEKEIKTIQKSIEQAKTILEIIESSMNREDTSDGEQDSFEDSEDESLEYEEEENGYYPTGGSSFESGKKGGYVGDTSYGNYDSTGMGVFEYLRNGVGDGGSTKPVKSKKKIIIKDEDEDEDENKDEGVSEVQLSKPVESKSGKLYVFEDDTGERVEVRCNRCYKEDFGDIEDFMKHSDKVHGVKYNDKQEVINECGIYEVIITD